MKLPHEDLADEKWRVCSRKGSHVYNRALLASIIAHKGEEQAEKWPPVWWRI